ncbi:MAG: hypothetical protein ACO39Y_08020 [Ilumatobacteraceae bacterium]
MNNKIDPTIDNGISPAARERIFAKAPGPIATHCEHTPMSRAAEAAALIEEARRDGLDVTADCYPYDAWASTITVLVPSRRHDDPVAVRRKQRAIAEGGNPYHRVAGMRSIPNKVK